MNNTPVSFTPAHILVVDDEPDLLTLYELALLREGHRVETAASLMEARESLRQRRFDLLITDMRLPDGLGLSLLHELGQQHRSEKTVVITAHGSAEGAVEALKAGAFDYLSKPLDLKQFRTVVAAALQAPHPQVSGTAPAPRTTNTKHTGNHPLSPHANRLLGESLSMQHVKDRIAKVANSMAPVMILGESGTGKELVARAIHEASPRCTGPFVAVNCGAIPDTLLEAEFFGARKGAYTGATTDRIGYFTAARNGTLFLDEIGDLPLVMQAKLLRVLQERRVRPLGGIQEDVVDVRILCATHKDLAAAVEKAEFRQDLYYRLNVIDIRLPPLRERREDLDVLIAGLMERLCHDSGHAPVRLTPAARAWLHQQAFPGNVRELENMLHRALALCLDDVIDIDVLQDGPSTSNNVAVPETFDLFAPSHKPTAHPPTLPTPTSATPTAPRHTSDGPPPVADAVEHLPPPLPNDLQIHLDQIEKTILIQALQETKGNRTAAAHLLGLNLRQIRYRIARLQINLSHHNDQPNDDGDSSL
jgi:two-component system response regulator PilR (NtrC family)